MARTSLRRTCAEILGILRCCLLSVRQAMGVRRQTPTLVRVKAQVVSQALTVIEQVDPMVVTVWQRMDCPIHPIGILSSQRRGNKLSTLFDESILAFSVSLRTFQNNVCFNPQEFFILSPHLSR